jgi:YVTN family beta-propeller protein
MRSLLARIRRHLPYLAAPVLCALALGIGVSAASAQTAYVTNLSADSVTPFETETGVVGTAIPVGDNPRAVAVTPDGATAYVVNLESDDATPIDTATGTAGPAIDVGEAPVAIAIAPDGATAYVVDADSDEVTPIDVATNTAATPIAVGNAPAGIAISPDGSTAYVANVLDDTVSTIDLATGTPGTPIAVGDSPVGLAISPDGKTAYVANAKDDTVSPIDLASDTAEAPIAVGDGPQVVAITPDGSRAYVLDIVGNEVTPIDLAGRAVGEKIITGAAPFAVAVAPDGSTLYITNAESSTVTPVDTGTDAVGTAIPVDVAAGIALVPYQAPAAAFSAAAAPAGRETSFDASASSDLDGHPASYAWDFGDGESLVSSSPIVSHTYDAPGSYTATLRVTNAGGCSTEFVFTGQTAACNGSPAAQTKRTLPVADALFERPAAAALPSLPRRFCPVAAWLGGNPPTAALNGRRVPGLQASLSFAADVTRTEVSARLVFRRGGDTHRVALGEQAFEGPGRHGLRLPLPASLRRALPTGSRVRLGLTISTWRGPCSQPLTTHRAMRRAISLVPAAG